MFFNVVLLWFCAMPFLVARSAISAIDKTWFPATQTWFPGSWLLSCSPIFYIVVSFTGCCITLIAARSYQFCAYLSLLCHIEQEFEYLH